MRYRSLLAAALGAAAGLAVAGCSAASTSTTTTPAFTSPATSAATQPASGTTSAPAASQPAQQGQAGGGNCQPATLGITLASGSSAASGGPQTTLTVDLTNKGPAACTMDGFPGVNLVGAASGQASYTWPLGRAAQAYRPVSLQPGGTAHFTIVYLPGSTASGSTDITVARILLTPPNDYTHATVPWTQSVLLQDAATHPGTYITPVVTGP